MCGSGSNDPRRGQQSRTSRGFVQGREGFCDRAGTAESSVRAVYRAVAVAELLKSALKRGKFALGSNQPIVALREQPQSQHVFDRVLQDPDSTSLRSRAATVRPSRSWETQSSDRPSVRSGWESARWMVAHRDSQDGTAATPAKLMRGPDRPPGSAATWAGSRWLAVGVAIGPRAWRALVVFRHQVLAVLSEPLGSCVFVDVHGSVAQAIRAVRPS